MDMQAFREKKRKRKLNHAAEMGNAPGEYDRELLNRSGFNKTPRMPAKETVMSDPGSMIRGHDVQDREDIPLTDEMYHMRADKTSSKAPEKAGLMKFETQGDQERVNRQSESPMRMKHGKRIFARDPNYNPEPTTPAPSGPGTKQTNAVVGSPKKSLNTYPAGGPGGTSDGVGGPMRDMVQGHTPTGKSPSNFSHRNVEHSSQGAPSGMGPVPGNAMKSLAQYPGGGKTKKRKMSRRGMAFVGRQGPGRFSEGSPA